MSRSSGRAVWSSRSSRHVVDLFKGNRLACEIAQPISARRVREIVSLLNEAESARGLRFPGVVRRTDPRKRARARTGVDYSNSALSDHLPAALCHHADEVPRGACMCPPGCPCYESQPECKRSPARRSRS